VQLRSSRAEPESLEKYYQWVVHKLICDSTESWSEDMDFNNWTEVKELKRARNRNSVSGCSGEGRKEGRVMMRGSK